MTPTRYVFALVAAACSTAVLAQDDPLAALLACDVPAIAALTPGDLAARLAAEPGLTCRERQLRTGTSIECDSARDRQALGLVTREFGSTQGNDGERGVRIVFRASAPRVRDAAATRLRTTFRADDDGFIATLAAQPPHDVRVLPREDGSTVLSCTQRIARDEAEGLALGIDATRGGIAGRLSVPGDERPLPAMRVCAVPRDAYLRARCIVTAEGATDYLITGLAPGPYDIASFALAHNSNGWVGAHATRLGDCGPNRTDCAGGMLIAVDVRAGRIVTDIDPDRFYTTLPPRFDLVRDGGHAD
jgi:hypothetical protein